MNAFLVLLVVKFARQNKSSETKDPILGRKVPSIVFLRNIQLVKESMKEWLDNAKKKKEAIMLQAQLNEYMYAMLRQNGVAARLDENIGIEFIDLARSSQCLIVET